MAIDQLLKELDEKKVTEPMIKKDELLPEKVSISLPQQKEMIRKFLEGKSKKDIGKEYNISLHNITKIIEGNKGLLLETEKRYQSVALSRENYRLSETKDKLLSFIDTTLDEAMSNPEDLTPEVKLKVLNSIAALFDKLSITSRLNSEKPTDITENRNININVDKILKKLKTPEDKLDFLRNQNANGGIIEAQVEEENKEDDDKEDE